MDYNIILLVCSCSVIISILLLISHRLLIDKNKSPFLTAYSFIEISILSFFAVFCLMIGYQVYTLIVFILYTAIVFIEKMLIGLLFGKINLKQFFAFKYFYILVSSDYAFTDLQKNILCGADKKETKLLKARLIKVNNIVNFLLTLLIAIIAITVKSVVSNGLIIWFLNSFLLIRIVSRSMEIIISFGKDVFDNNKTSSLINSQRIILAIVSIFEMLLAFISFIYRKGIHKDIISKSIDTLFFGSVGHSSLTALVSITGLVLIGIVIAQYLSADKDIPIVYLIDKDKNELVNALTMKEKSIKNIFVLNIDNEYDESIIEMIICYKGEYYGYEYLDKASIHNTEKASHFDNFIVSKENVNSIVFNTTNLKIYVSKTLIK